MNKYVLVGLAVVAVALGLTLWSNQGARLILNGSIQKIRLQAVDDENTVAVVEFRLNNPADLPYDVKDVKLLLEPASGAPVEGALFRQKDLDGFFEFHKATLGQKYNDTVRIGERWKSHAQVDKTIAANFPVNAGALSGRKRLLIRLWAGSGIVPTDIAEQR